MPKIPNKATQEAIMDAAHRLRDEIMAVVQKAREANPNKDWERVLVGHAITCLCAKLEDVPGMKNMGSIILGDLLQGGVMGVTAITIETEPETSETKH